MEICIVECLRLPSEEREHFGAFSSWGKAIEALRERGEDSAILTTMEIDRTYEDGEPDCIFYVRPNKGDCEEGIGVEELSKRMGIKYID